MKRILLHTGLLIALLVGILIQQGCCPEYPACDTDEHCAEHEQICVDMMCRECKTDEACQEKHGGDACFACTQKHACERRANCCVKDTECSGGAKCAKHKCVLCPGGCPKGKICSGGTCEWLCGLHTISMAYAKNEIAEETDQLLKENVVCIKKMGVKIRVEGHTDVRGTETYNMELSEGHANRIKDALIERGVPEELLVPVGMGETAPLCNDDTEECHQRNRRAEFVPSP